MTVMAEEDIHYRPRLWYPITDSQQMDSASKYYSFEFISINYIPEGRAFLEPKLSRVELMIRQIPHEATL